MSNIPYDSMSGTKTKQPNNQHESERMYERRPMTSYSKYQSTTSNQSPAFLSNNLPRTHSPSYPSFGLVRPSTVSSANRATGSNEIYNQGKMKHLGQSQSMAGFQHQGYDKNATKKIPNHIMHDKEKLYETQLQLRSMINGIQEENMKLKTKNLNLEREAKKFERIIEETNAGKSHTQQQQKENALSIRLRKQLKECQKEMEQKNNELSEFKKQMTTTKLQELEIENQVLTQESLKLKYKLDQCLKLNQGFGFDQTSETAWSDGPQGISKKVENLKNDNLEMAVLIQKLEKEKNEINLRQKESDRQVQRMMKERMFMQKQLAMQEDELKQFSKNGQQSPNGKRNSQQSMTNSANNNNNPGLAEQNSKLKADLEKTTKENTKLSTQIIVKIERIKELEDKSRRDNQDAQERIEVLKMQKENAERNLAEDSQIQQTLQERITELEQQLEAERKTSKTNVKGDDNSVRQTQVNNNNGGTRTIIQSEKHLGGTHIHTNNKRSSLLMQRKLMPRVTMEDVQKIGQDLKYCLLLKNIRFEEIDSYLIIPELKRKGRASILDIISILQREPFNMENHDDALSVARYTIEDNSEDKISFNENQTNDISVVKTVFRNLIGKYEIFNNQEELELYSDIAKLFTLQRQGLKQNVEFFKKQSKEGLEEGICRLEDLKKAMSDFDTGITPRHVEFIVMKIYEDSRDTNKVLYLQLLDIFSIEEYERYQQIMNQKQSEEKLETQSINQQDNDDYIAEQANFEDSQAEQQQE